jgi:hypothetical protein
MAKTQLSLASVVAQSPELVSTQLQGHTALLSITNGSYYGMDRVGSRVWELIAQPRAVAAVVEQLLTEFAVARPTCEQHVLDFLQKLADANLLTITDEPTR